MTNASYHPVQYELGETESRERPNEQHIVRVIEQAGFMLTDIRHKVGEVRE